MNNNEIELTLFGPGYGEGILMHLGFNDWIVVDSCINPHTKKPAILEYMEGKNISPDNIKLIIATHWHDDHIRGLYEILKCSKNAKLIISEALRQDEFVRLVSIYSNPMMIASYSGLAEFANIFRLLRHEKKKPVRAIANRILHQRNKRLGDKNYTCTLTALSPSDSAILLSNLQLTEFFPSKKEEKKRLPSILPNHSSIVLWITFNEKAVLLGSDLEVGSDRETGWKAILCSDIQPTNKADVYKVAHHGSDGADLDEIWENFLTKEPYAILTPFNRGNIALPKYRDMQRIKEKTKKCFITALNTPKKAKVHKKEIDKLMGQSLRFRRIVNPEFGFISLRSTFDESDKWLIELSGNAASIENILNKKQKKSKKKSRK